MDNYKKEHQIVDLFEELLDKHGIYVPDEDREGGEEEACLYGTTYYNLVDQVKEILDAGPKWDISHMAYELYKKDWLRSHLSTEADMKNLRDYFMYVQECNEELEEEPMSFDDWWWDTVDTSYVCYDEFMGAEYLRTDYIESLLKSAALIDAYREDLEKMGLQKFWVKFAVGSRFIARVWASSVESAKRKAEYTFGDAYFGEAYDIDGEIVAVEDGDGNFLYVK